MSARKYDIVIVGGGFVGATLALALAPLSLKIAVIESKVFDLKPGQGKALAMVHASQQLFQHLNVWPLVADIATPIEAVHVSEKGQFGAARLTASDTKMDALGYMVMASDLMIALNDTLKKTSVDLISPATVLAVKKQHQQYILDVESDNEISNITCDLLVAADGATSKIREALNIKTTITDDDHAAIVTKIHLARPHKNTAYQRFTDQGILAMLPVENNTCVNVISGTKKQIQDWEALSDDNFIAKLQKTFGYRLGRIQAVEKRFNFPLANIQADKQVQDSAIIMGNAAHTIHPVAAQGLNLSLRDVALLVDLLKEAIADSKAVNDQTVLNEYIEQRKSDQKMTTMFTKSLVDIFSSDLSVLKSGRTLSLMMLDVIKPLKQHLIKRAMGYGGKVSKTIRGL